MSPDSQDVYTGDAPFPDKPSLKQFDFSNVPEPEDGLLYLVQSSVTGFWTIYSDEDIAMEDATGYPVGELVEYEADDWPEPIEYGNILVLEVENE